MQNDEVWELNQRVTLKIKFQEKDGKIEELENDVAYVDVAHLKHSQFS